MKKLKQYLSHTRSTLLKSGDLGFGRHGGHRAVAGDLDGACTGCKIESVGHPRQVKVHRLLRQKIEYRADETIPCARGVDNVCFVRFLRDFCKTSVIAHRAVCALGDDQDFAIERIRHQVFRFFVFTATLRQQVKLFA